MLSWFLVLCGIALAAPETGSEEQNTPTLASDTSEIASFSSSLFEAKQQYFAGERDDAKRLFSELQVRLLMGEDVAWEPAAEAMVYLGEILLVDGEPAKAREIFRWVLEQNPDYLLSPYAHPIEVVGEFVLVREQVQREIASRPVPPPYRPEPTPAWTVLPLGIPQFAEKHPARGLVFGALQLGLASTSVGLYLSTNRMNSASRPHPLGIATDQVESQTNLLRYGAQWPVTIAFYGVWLGSWGEARRSWKNEQRIKAELTWMPRPDAPATLGVSGRF